MLKSSFRNKQLRPDRIFFMLLDRLIAVLGMELELLNSLATALGFGVMG